MNTVVSNCPPQLNCCDRQTLINYFQEAWQLEDMLLKSLVGEDTFYLNPDPLRNPLIFYLGHSPSFYINKLVQVGLLEKCLNQDYEILFGVGVDPEIPEELNQAIAHMEWPEVSSAWEYREQAYKILSELIQKTPITLPILPDSPLWALIMGIEHQRIHVETSSMLFRQLPLERVKRPSNWKYAPSKSYIPENEMLKVAGGIAQLGKDFDDSTYGWDIDYGSRTVEVAPFLASKYLITNSEFLDFVKAGGYGNQEYWDEKSWQWKTENNIQHPKFWISQNGSYKYRAQFDEIDLPLDWPVEVNYYEAMAYCQWQGTRLMTEAEWNRAWEFSTNNQITRDNNYNLNLKYISPSPVGMFSERSGLADLRGNLWEWLSSTFSPLPGFTTHYLYEDQSAPFFDGKHQMMVGGSWATNGTMALPCYRNWFRPYFYQHVGFRTAMSL